MSLQALRPYLDAQITTLPLLTVHVTSACDSRCIGCSYGVTGGVALTAADAAALAREADALDVRVVLVTGGEPLVVPHLEELVAPFARPGRRLYLATSGTRLEARAPMVGRWFHELFVSLDGPDAASHDAIRGVPTFDALGRGIAALRAVAPAVRVTARCTVSARNIERVADVAFAAAAMGIDRVSYLPVDAWSSAFGRDGREPLAALVPTRAQVAALRAAIPAIEERLGPELVPNLEHVGRYLDAAAGAAPYPAKRCNTPMVSAVVDADGAVRPCFFKAPIGHVRDGGLRAVLQAEPARRLRATLDTAADPECQRCVCPKYFPLRDLLMGKIR